MEKIKDKFPGCDLNVSDRAYCDRLHLLYVKRFTLLNKLYTGNTTEWLNYQVNSSFQDPFPEQTRLIRKYLDDIKEIYRQTNTAFILAVERYFRELYNMKIDRSYVKQAQNADRLYQCYDPIILNIIRQEDAEFLLSAIRPIGR